MALTTILTDIETRVLGSLVEKQVTTPEYYPLTLNSLTLACNQKNNRSPVTSYSEEEVAQALKGARKPVVLYVGPKSIYAQAHIPGAENIGPVARPEGMEKLRARATSLPKDSPVVIYCGCCPWEHCPNIRPAYAELRKAGFTSVRVLYL